jgi:beta-carotene 3-hydroxylase
VLIALVAALLMEPVAALAHRLVMHRRVGWRWHRSHHRSWRAPDRVVVAAGPRPASRGWWEANDGFPLVFAAATIAVMASGGRAVRQAGAGVAAYGVAYALVHDVCIHGRLTGGQPVIRGRWLRWVARSHAVHHRTGAAPYGFLLPIVPARCRAATRALRVPGTRARVEKTS